MPPRRSARVADAESRTLGAFEVLPEELLCKALLALLPPDARLRCAVLSKRFAALLSNGAMWTNLRFDAVCAPRGVDDAGLAALCARAGAQLRCLDLSCQAACTRLTPEGVVAALRDASGLEELRFEALKRVEYDTKLWFTAAQAQAMRVSCPCLTLGWMNVRPAAGESFDAIFASFEGVRRGVFLHDLRLNDGHMPAIAAAIGADPSIEQLCVRNNRFSPAGASALADMLATNRSLSNLDISSNLDFGDAGAIALAGALARNSTLRILYVSGNRIGTEGAMAIAAALELNQTLEVLVMSKVDMRGSEISDEAVAALRAVRAARAGRGVPLELHWLQRLLFQSVADADDVVQFLIYTSMQFSRLITPYAEKRGLPAHAVQLELENWESKRTVIDNTDSIGKYDLDDQAVIYVRLLEEPPAASQ